VPFDLDGSGATIPVTRAGTYAVVKLSLAPLSGCDDTVAPGNHVIQSQTALNALASVTAIEGSLTITASELEWLQRRSVAQRGSRCHR
jgi:hypothetical protein